MIFSFCILILYKKELSTIKKKPNLFLSVAIYYLLLLSLWFVFHLIFSPWQMVHTDQYLGEVINSLTKVTLWILPSIYLIRNYKSELTYSLTDLFYSKIKWPIAMWGVLLFICIPLIRDFILKKSLTLNKEFKASDWIWIAVVGFTEEIVFRGLIQNALTSKMQVSYAMIITNILFIIIHFPIQMHNGEFPSLPHFINIFIMGMIFSYSLDKTKNLYVPIILHTLYDLFITAF
jgi:membrane protease YdiL (CAAX protease family)